MTMQELLDIGALPLPDDLYYHVYISSDTGRVNLIVYKPRKWLWDKYIHGANDWPMHVNAIKETVPDVIKRLSHRYPAELARKKEQREWYENAKKYEGDHK